MGYSGFRMPNKHKPAFGNSFYVAAFILIMPTLFVCIGLAVAALWGVFGG